MRKDLAHRTRVYSMVDGARSVAHREGEERREMKARSRNQNRTISFSERYLYQGLCATDMGQLPFHCDL